MKSVSRENFLRAEIDNQTNVQHLPDLAGPIEPTEINGHKYAITFTDNFSGSVFVYFLKTKKDTVSATKKFIADTIPPPQT